MRPFRHISCYKISVPTRDSDIVRIIKAMEELRFQPCGDEDTLSVGFEPWVEQGSVLWTKAEVSGLVCRVKIQRKTAPPSLVSDRFNGELNRITSSGRVLSSEERSQLKSNISHQLSLQALPSSKLIPVLFNEHTGKLWIDTINARLQRKILELLGKAFPNTTVSPDLVAPNLPTLLRDLVTARAPDLPKGFRFLGDNRIQVPGVGVRNGSPAELSRIYSDTDLKVVYLSMHCSGLQFRWHGDGSISHIESSGGKDRHIQNIDLITQSIDDWLKRKLEQNPNDHQKAQAFG